MNPVKLILVSLEDIFVSDHSEYIFIATKK